MSEEQLCPAEEMKPQEPPKFSVKTVIDAKIQLEASRGLMKTGAKILCGVCFAILLLSLALMVWQFVLTQTLHSLTMCLFILSAMGYLFYIIFAVPKKSLRRWEESVMQNYGTPEFHLTTEFYSHSLAQTLEEKQAVTVQGYSEISGLRETAHLFLLRRAKNRWFFVSKEGFQIGSAEEFRAFIKERIGA